MRFLFLSLIFSVPLTLDVFAQTLTLYYKNNQIEVPKKAAADFVREITPIDSNR